MKKSLGISLVLMALLFSMASAQSLKKNASGVYVSELEQGKIAMKSGQRLVINAASTLNGELTLRSGGNDCRYQYEKLLKTPTKVEAADYAQVISVEADLRKDAVILSLRAPAQAPWSGTNNSGRLKIEITIPENCVIEINTAYFDIIAVGPFSAFTVAESLSRVHLDGVNGNVAVKVSNRPLIIKNVNGNINAINKYDKLRLENIDTGGELGTIRNEHGEVSIDGYRGAIDARTSYEKLIGQNLQLTGTKNRVKNTSAVISLSFDSLDSGSIRVNNQYENININVKSHVDAQFICKIGEDGSVTADNLDILPGLVDEGRLEFESGEGTAELRLTARGSGNITINGPNGTDTAGGR